MAYDWDDRDRRGGYGPGYGREGYRGGNWDWMGRDRDWSERAGDEMRSWFGDEEAGRRRRMDEMRAREHRGRGPKGYKRSDERIREDVNDRLSDDWWLDASDIEVSVSNGEVTLSGTVKSRDDKRRAEDIAEQVLGVSHVQNNLRVQRSGETSSSSSSGLMSGTSGSTTSDVSRASGGTAGGTAGTTTGSSSGRSLGTSAGTAGTTTGGPSRSSSGRSRSSS